ncbi:Cell death protease [Cryptotrichosporon argae]
MDTTPDTRARIRGLFTAHTERAELGEPSVRRRETVPRQANSGLPTAADFYVHELPGIGHPASHPTHSLVIHAGELPSYPGEGNGGGEGATGQDAQLFFMKINARRAAGKQRVIFWFNGGPGCSSFDGSLMEVGPFRTVPGAQTESGQVELELIEGGWEEFATIVFIDQPPGTGLSYIPTNGYLHELDQGSAHLIQFLQNFYTVFPELDGLDTYLAGESFAGQYIPYFADALIKTTLLPNLQLKGIAIGNGWIDPQQQYPGYADFAYEKELIKEGTPESDTLQEALKRCQDALDKFTDPLKQPVNVNECGNIMDLVSAPFTQELNGQKVCLNVYDVRLVDQWPACGMNWPPDLTEVYDFLRRKDVVSALHATMHETAWVECDGRVASELHLRTSPAAVHLIPGIVEAGVEVMMFAGAEDLICNYKGIERMLEHMEWAGEVGMGNATAETWKLNGTQVGTWQIARNMTYAKIFDASHMVGFDVPHVAHDMMLRFMGVDLALLPGHTATFESSVGDDERVSVGVLDEAPSEGLALLKGGDTDWETYYNAFSALFILAVLASIVGGYWYLRSRRVRLGAGASAGRRRRHTGAGAGERDADRDREERVPLGAEYEMDEHGEREMGYAVGAGAAKGKGKGKERARDSEDGREVVFALGDDEDR